MRPLPSGIVTQRRQRQTYVRVKPLYALVVLYLARWSFVLQPLWQRGAVLAAENSRRGLGREDGGFVCNGGLGEEVVILEEERRFLELVGDWEGAMWLGWG